MSADAGFEVVVGTDGGIAPEELARHGVAGARTCASWPRSNVRRSAGSMACSGGGPSGVLEGLRSCQPPRSGGRRVGPDLCRSVRVVADTTCTRLIPRGRRAPEYAARERSSGPSTTPTAASPSPWRADLTCTTSIEPAGSAQTTSDASGRSRRTRARPPARSRSRPQRLPTSTPRSWPHSATHETG